MSPRAQLLLLCSCLCPFPHSKHLSYLPSAKKAKHSSAKPLWDTPVLPEGRWDVGDGAWSCSSPGMGLTALITARLEMCFIPAFLLPAIPTVASGSLKLENAGNEGGRGWNCHILCTAGRIWDKADTVQSSAEEPEPFQVAGTGKGHSPRAVFGLSSQAQGSIAGVSWGQNLD